MKTHAHKLELRERGAGHTATLWSFRGGNLPERPESGPLGPRPQVHEDRLGQSGVPGTSAGAEASSRCPDDVDDILPAGGSARPEPSEGGSGNLGVLGQVTEHPALSLRSEVGARWSEPMTPVALRRMLNATPIGPVVSERQLFRHRVRADHAFSVGRKIDFLHYVAWLVLERHAPGKSRRRHAPQRAIRWRDLERLLAAQRYCCALTGQALTPETAALDHRLPVSRGGQHVIENAQILHKQVNRAKATMTNTEFVAMCRAVAKWADTGHETS
jgi:5-methylcytosine-specific restriction endonuclease McrA